MVFIIKIPNKNRNQNQSEHENENESANQLEREGFQSETSNPESNPYLYPHPHPQSGHPNINIANPNPSPTSTTRQYLSPAAVDILLAPAVINHEFVRSNDKSLIVERPERVFAILLAISNLWSRCLIEKEAMAEAAAAKEKEKEKERGNNTPRDHDDKDESHLKPSFSSTSNGNPGSKSTPLDSLIATHSPFHLIKTTRSLALQPPHPSVAFVHSDPDERFEKPNDTPYQSRRNRSNKSSSLHKDKATSEKVEWEDSTLDDQLSKIHLDDKSSNPSPNLNPDPNSSSNPSNGLKPSTTSEKNPRGQTSREMISHCEYLQLLTCQAPHLPPRPRSKPVGFQTKVLKSTKSPPEKAISRKKSTQLQRERMRVLNSDLSSASSSDASASSQSEGESDQEEEEGGGNGESHPSEVPLHLAQGDLYLKGPRPKRAKAGMEKGHDHQDQHQDQDQDAGGSSEAIRHALGACAEAVDRIVWGAEFNRKLKAGNPHSFDFKNQPGQGQGLDEEQISSALKEIGKEVPDHGELLLPFQPDSNCNCKSNSTSIYSSRGEEKLSNSTLVVPLPSTKSFVITRPPGHHCGSGSLSSTSPSSIPSGFCWVNNAIVTCAHAYLNHSINRVVILDLDLHHGNGTQSLAWKINEESFRRTLEDKARREAERFSKEGKTQGQGQGEGEEGGNQLEIFYGSLHDIESYPCEDGNVEMIKEASTCLFGNHGQWIWNVHLESYDSSESFASLYSTKYSILLSKAREFLSRSRSRSPSSSGPGPGPGPGCVDHSKNLIILSTGFDSNQHELVGMQRHGKNVPTDFFRDFTRESVEIAEELCEGKLISLLEGGYSDRTLISGGLSHLNGFFNSKHQDGDDDEEDKKASLNEESESESESAEKASWVESSEYWNLENLLLLEKYHKKLSTLCDNDADSYGDSYRSSLGKAKESDFDGSMKALRIPKALDSSKPWLRKTFETFWKLNRVFPFDKSSDPPDDKKQASLSVGGDAIDDSTTTLDRLGNGGRSLRDRRNLKSPERWKGDYSLGNASLNSPSSASTSASASTSSPSVRKKGTDSKSKGKEKEEKEKPSTTKTLKKEKDGEETSVISAPNHGDQQRGSSSTRNRVEDESAGLVDCLSSLSMEEGKEKK